MLTVRDKSQFREAIAGIQLVSAAKWNEAPRPRKFTVVIVLIQK